MRSWLRGLGRRVYRRLLEREIAGTPTHVAVIQDGNRRYARAQDEETTSGHREGAETTERMVRWCAELGIEELTLYAFSTENFKRPPEEREALFDLIAEKLRAFAEHDEVEAAGVRIHAVGELDRLPERVREAIDYAEGQTADNDRFRLNVALAYGGRAELLTAARRVAARVETGQITPEDIDVSTVEDALYDGPGHEVDLIIRTGGAERTSNFLPWRASGNEAAVYFCTPYWPEFSKVDLLRGVRTYESRRASHRRTRARRALALLRTVQDCELDEARAVLRRLRDSVPERTDVDALLDRPDETGDRPN
ncbi:polyprenyl diphosphate synthase [Halococcoides cellulosivorans]|uniref:Tritrans,polycis-undecaprenyl-diphosphate synthase (geranylgeranyl-diphosphate specific) n=1 Tax=Halococcoides cellulosivorans TaxID=1679096 RepID=A0A2R4X4D8_9EURY|nr:polyprenyl diphosphate synthase [Halococcoides cellulosivorans]AWB28657.1 di-trans,poly-cis-decaprenylcistransferase [Halococcoides cellulosivorans]